MAAKVLNCGLNHRNLNGVIKYLTKYRNDLPSKVETLLRRLTDEVGIPVVDTRYAAGKGDSSPDYKTAFTVSTLPNGLIRGVLTVEGEDIGFVEFGAGIHFNTPAGTSPHPKGAEFGYTIGSYGKGQGANDSWMYYDSYGMLHRSYGTEASMPVYSAAQAMRQELIRICTEVFA